MMNKNAWQGVALGMLAAVCVAALVVPSLGVHAADGGALANEPQGFGGSSPLVIPAAAFRSDGNDPDGFFFDFAGGYMNGDGTACLKAAVYLPQGAIVQGVYASVYDNAAGNVMVNLRRVDRSTGASDVMASLGTTTDGTSIQHVSDETIGFPEVRYPAYAYYATTCLNYADHRLYSVRIYYEYRRMFLPVVVREG